MRLPAAERREQLIEVATSVFAEQGFHTTSMNDVAEAAGVTKPVLYQHFSSKRNLFLELLTDIGDQLRERIAKATASAPGPRQQIEAGFRAYFDYMEANTDAYRVLFGAGVRRDPEFASLTQAVEESIAEAIAELIVVDGHPAEDRELIAHTIVGMTEAASRYWIAHDREPPLDQLSEAVARLAWSGLRGVTG
ncbi:MAG: TetR/AcrR family transcriptional regulator [Microthrixaceae bacterium]|nr:TetR/AcrR family transcriptional regulator [Microthrixaceae bacterium]